jgi:hypothetical protein
MSGIICGKDKLQGSCGRSGSLSIMLPKFNMESKACTNHSRSALQQGLKRMALELLYIYINMDRYKLNIIQLDIKRDIEDSITTHM